MDGWCDSNLFFNPPGTRGLFFSIQKTIQNLRTSSETRGRVYSCNSIAFSWPLLCSCVSHDRVQRQLCCQIIDLQRRGWSIASLICVYLLRVMSTRKPRFRNPPAFDVPAQTRVVMLSCIFSSVDTVTLSLCNLYFLEFLVFITSWYIRWYKIVCRKYVRTTYLVHTNNLESMEQTLNVSFFLFITMVWKGKPASVTTGTRDRTYVRK